MSLALLTIVGHDSSIADSAPVAVSKLTGLGGAWVSESTATVNWSSIVASC